MKPRITKTRAQVLARKAREHGHFQYPGGWYGVRCPGCREEVRGCTSILQMSVVKALDRAMIYHLQWDCETPPA